MSRLPRGAVPAHPRAWEEAHRREMAVGARGAPTAIVHGTIRVLSGGRTSPPTQVCREQPQHRLGGHAARQIRHTARGITPRYCLTTHCLGLPSKEYYGG